MIDAAATARAWDEVVTESDTFLERDGDALLSTA